MSFALGTLCVAGSLGISAALNADSATHVIALDEDFLLFLAEGMDVDGDWHDPMTLAEISELHSLPNEELDWVAEQNSPSQKTGQASNEVINGDNNE